MCKSSMFPNSLKFADVTTLHKEDLKKKTTDQLVFYFQLYQNFL